MDNDELARTRRIATAPRLGTSEATCMVQDLFNKKPLVLEAYFFRGGCSSDFYLLNDESEFEAATAGFRGDSPELHLYRADNLMDISPLRVWPARSDTDCLKAELEQLASQTDLLLRCRRSGYENLYFMVNTEGGLNEFTDHNWVGWEVAACDVWESTDRAKCTMVMVMPPCH